MLKKIVYVVLVLFMIMNVKKTVYAQDFGIPVMKQLTYYSMIGGFAGALLGGSVWFTDPLSPNVDFSSNVTNGFAYGIILGFGLGVHQMYNALQKAEEEEEPDEEDLPPPFDFDPDPVIEEELIAWRLNKFDPNTFKLHQSIKKQKLVFQSNIIQFQFQF